MLIGLILKTLQKISRFSNFYHISQSTGVAKPVPLQYLVITYSHYTQVYPQFLPISKAFPQVINMAKISQIVGIWWFLPYLYTTYPQFGDKLHHLGLVLSTLLDIVSCQEEKKQPGTGKYQTSYIQYTIFIF